MPASVDPEVTTASNSTVSRPGTSAMTTEQRVAVTLAKYRRRVEEIMQEGKAKPDMVAYAELRKELTPEDRYGHLPGINVADKFNNRGELAILGLHTQIMRGIYYKKPGSGPGSGKGALAIVLSGGYADDKDEGESFWYTGEGGQKKGRQVEDQVFVNGNLALKTSFETGTPVRVFRGSKAGKLQYTYEGLYKVVAVKHEPSQDGPLVCRFNMQAIPGESVVTSQVLHKSMTRSAASVPRLKRNQLANMAADQPKLKRPRHDDTARSRQKLLEEVAGRPGLICADISNGLEPNVPIPLFNDVDDRRLGPEFTYMAKCEFAPGLRDQAAEVLECEEERLRVYTRHNETKGCGVTFRKIMLDADKRWYDNLKANPPAWAQDQPILAESFLVQEHNYSDEGALLSTEPCGIHECGGPKCTTAACQRNMQVTRGIRVPLEVFMTRSKGWGVRCREPLAAGAFVCSYVGEIISEAMVQQLDRSSDNYLFSLDYFMHLFKDLYNEGMDLVELDAPAHKMPPLPRLPFPPHITGKGLDSPGSPSGRVYDHGDDYETPFSVDAHNKGNVARFINHACNPLANLIIQGVFATEYRSTILYHIALFANRDIPAMEELTYDYGYGKQQHIASGDRGMKCHCGAPGCTGILL